MGHLSEARETRLQPPDAVERRCGLYPALEAFSGDYDAQDYRDWVEESNGDPLPASLIMYIQDGVAPDSPVADRALVQAIQRELHLQGGLYDNDRPLKQLILSGAVATGWSDDRLYELVSTIQSTFYIHADSLENWCACCTGAVPSAERLRLLRVLGFSQLRLRPTLSGPSTYAVDRLVGIFSQAKQLGFKVTVLDLSALQADAALQEQLLVAVLQQAQPDRIRTALPQPALSMASYGYQDIGLGWYLRTGDGWWAAQNAGRLYWTLLGYSEFQSPDIVGVGPGALSAVCDFYALHERSVEGYTEKLAAGDLPIVSGVALEDADVLRREIVGMILAASCIRVSALENKWGIRFEQFFTCESELLRTFERNRWVRWRNDRIEIKTRADRELTAICHLFDGRSDNPLTHAAHPGGRTLSAAYTRTVSL